MAEVFASDRDIANEWMKGLGPPGVLRAVAGDARDEIR
jgi:hypothetical protein